jgi:hypothetical protein
MKRMMRVTQFRQHDPDRHGRSHAPPRARRIPVCVCVCTCLCVAAPGYSHAGLVYSCVRAFVRVMATFVAHVCLHIRVFARGCE